MNESADKILESAKGKYPVVLVLGVDGNDILNMITNVPQYQFMQWLINKASFELYINERDSKQTKENN